MTKKHYVLIGLVTIITLIGINIYNKERVEVNVEIVEENIEVVENNNEYKLIYENPIDGGTIEKKVDLSSENIEEEIVYELFKLENIPQNLHNAFNSGKLKVLNVEYVKEEKKVKIDFNKELFYYEKPHNDVRYFRSAIYDTLAQFTSVEYVEIYIEGKFVEGLGELVVSGKIHREN